MNRRDLLLKLASLGCAPAVGACATRVSRPSSPDACAATIRIDSPDAPMPAELRGLVEGAARIDYLLLGEIHDHPLHHRLRADWLAQLAGRGTFAIAMEQFDSNRQPDIDRARAEGAEPRAIAQAAGFSFRGWDWPSYEPFVALALRAKLPLVAANLSAAETRAIARGNRHPLAQREPRGWSQAERDLVAESIRDGHCGTLPESMIAPMSLAQRARDASIAQSMVDARRANSMPVVLIAGNGHVRNDLGVPRHLASPANPATPAEGVRIFTVGLVEEGGGERRDCAGTAFDLTIVTPAHPRPDPCEQLRKRPAARPG